MQDPTAENNVEGSEVESLYVSCSRTQVRIAAMDVEQSQEVPHEVECPVCFDPVVLFYRLSGCRHGLCLACIVKIRRPDRVIPCPLCRTESLRCHRPHKNDCKKKIVALDPCIEYLARDKYYFRKLVKDSVGFLYKRNLSDPAEIARLYKFVYPHLSSMQRYAIGFSVLTCGSNSHFKYDYAFRGHRMMESLLKVGNKTITQMYTLSLLKFETLKGCLKYGVHYRGLHPWESTIELEDGTVLNLVQFAIYASDDWEKFVREFPEDISDEYTILIDGLKRGIKDIHKQNENQPYSQTSKPKPLFNIVEASNTLHRIIKECRRIKKVNARKVWISSMSNTDPQCSDYWEQVVSVCTKDKNIISTEDEFLFLY